MRSAFAVLALLATALQAADWKSLKPQGYVSDFAHVIDATSKTALETYAAEVESATGSQMAFVTIQTLEGDPIEDVANDLFHAWGIGQKKQDNGILFMLVTGDRRSRLEVGHGLEPILPDGLDGLVLNDMRPALRQGQYGEALIAAAKRVGDIVAKDKGVTISAQLPAPRSRELPVRSIPWPLVIGVVLFLLFFARRGGGGNFFTGMLLGNLLSAGSRRGYGSGGYGGGYGGFGGGDGGGGGFGGFGGGDSGGGGASSDW